MLYREIAAAAGMSLQGVRLHVEKFQEALRAKGD
jgi:hypothetical protein